MNRPLRRVAGAALVLFALLLVNVNYVQAVRAGGLRTHPANNRGLVESYAQQRGPIITDGLELARSVATRDQLKYLRTYPGGRRYAAATGYFSLVYGGNGVERAENPLLAGTDDRLFVRRIGDLLTGRKPQGGAVVLTLQRAAQSAAYQGLAGRRGAVVALDPRTGAILALVSSPSYDPALLSLHDSKRIGANYRRLAADPDKPLLNRALTQTYPPGSLFKVVTTAAALASGNYTPDSRIPAPDALKLPGSTASVRNFGGETCGDGRTDTLRHALQISCNTAYAGLGISLGATALRNQAEAFGFDTQRTVPLPVAASVFPAGIDPAQTGISAIGQFDVRVTPLQAAMVAAAVGNGGVLMKPYLVASLQAPDLSTVKDAAPEEIGRATPAAVADSVATMMQAVVQSGTGTAAQIPGVAVAGKTGTAQHAPGKPPHAWFIGFAPAEDPKVAVAVLVEDGGGLGSDATGGRVAAPIARAVMQAVLSR